ncbi:hypothetical protein D3C87_2076420 [compost metagenome]
MFNIYLLHILSGQREIYRISESKAEDRIAARHAVLLPFRIRIPFEGFHCRPGVLLQQRVHLRIFKRIRKKAVCT